MTYNPAYSKRYRYDLHRGIDRSPIPADIVRNHLAWLDACMLSLRAIGDTADVSPTVISRVLRGKDQAGVHRAVAERLLAVTPAAVYNRPNADGFVPKIGAVRRIQALYAIGWTGDHVNNAAGKYARFAQNTINQRGIWITLDAWRAVVRAYDELAMTPGPSTVNRRRAQRAEWAPPLSWDDESIDDPNATPHVGEVTDARDRMSGRGTGRVNVDSLHDCSIEWGMTIDQAAMRLGVSRDAIYQGLIRLPGGDDEQRSALRAAFHRNEVAQGRDQPTRDGLGLRRTA